MLPKPLFQMPMLYDPVLPTPMFQLPKKGTRPAAVTSSSCTSSRTTGSATAVPIPAKSTHAITSSEDFIAPSLGVAADIASA